MSELENYYNEHASQARLHESQRERMTNIILAVTGVLVGLITFAELSLTSLPAAVTLLALGVFGYFFAGKHYERFRFHTTIMKAVRAEIDLRINDPNAPKKSLSELRSKGAKDHYTNFKWPRFRGTRSRHQASAKSWIARQRLHPFWEIIHIGVALLGLSLIIAIAVSAASEPDDAPVRVRLVE